MGEKNLADRRGFLKMTAGGVAGLSLINMEKALASPAAWTNKMPINPDIDNMKVICCYDTNMLKTGSVMTNFTSQNNAVNTNQVYANLDDMACRLAASSSLPAPTADQAWRKIFRSSKTWANTKVAIKVNCVNLYFMPRIAIVAKLCSVLNGFGVLGKNIIIYDGCNDASGSTKYTPYCSLTDATKINASVSTGDSLLGGKTSVTISGWTQNPFTCTSDIALGNVDILINCAVNKGHDRNNTGYYTLCMKNHYGTFDPPANLHGSTVPFISINQHDAIIGGNPVRQQLCIIDSLTGSTAHDPAAAPDVPPPCRIIMGTFAPAVDYLCVKKIREPIMNAVHDETVVGSLLSYFGYTDADTQWTEYTPGASSTRPMAQSGAGQKRVSVVLANGSFRSASVHFTQRSNLSSPIKISIFGMGGNLVYDKRIPPQGENGTIISWNGKTTGGNDVPEGMYVIKAVAGEWSAAEKMHVCR
jgi:Domain of unknown function (DUF362)